VKGRGFGASEGEEEGSNRELRDLEDPGIVSQLLDKRKATQMGINAI
jgi:hypothetical protein